MMAVCEKSGKELPERNNRFSGYECSYKKGWNCKYYSHVFVYGTNCLLLRPNIDVKSILGIGNKDSEENKCLNQ